MPTWVPFRPRDVVDLGGLRRFIHSSMRSNERFSMTRTMIILMGLEATTRGALPEERRRRSQSLSLRLYLVDNDTSPNSVVKANYKLIIYDQLFGNHVEKEGEQRFHIIFPYRLYCKLTWLKFDDPDCGLLVNDCCIFGVQVHEASVVKLVPNGVVECWILQKRHSCY
ncbi:putative inactive serine/threonine-protein kinase fnkC isoform X1 [Canna indica]|uniref:Inactive serine/threonine-protein kinase fnkC isoform X1 n=1 Tax=Canna indica TaxID=4628 RepID=A0AAQ3KJS0_9LILI|nr:putative inactive serine/threonine-protein kinase fnkC isoform X1 [Canna indica]